MNDDDANPAMHAETEAWSRAGSMPVGPSAPSPPPDADLAALNLEHYTVLKREDGTPWELGRGAMGVTYKAFDTRLRCAVALKVIHAALLQKRPVLRERFLREARIAASVRHPNVASVFHLGEAADGHCFYAMELIEGETLAQCVRRRGPLPAPMALDIAVQITHALVAAGQADMIHRDLKPANVMLTTGSSFPERPGSSLTGSDPGSGGGGVLVKVIDFGLARTVKAGPDSEPLTVAGGFVGTPQYASPEQLAGDEAPLDIRSDIFSLGSTLWFLLTGDHPFPGKSLEEILRQQLRPPDPARLRAAGVPEPVAALLRSMLAADPAERPQTPHALLEALRLCREQIQPTSAFAGQTGQRPGARAWPKVAGWLAAALVARAAVAGLWVWNGRPRPTPPAVAPLPPAPEKSIAVLPFDNLSADKENAYFTDGVQDEILTDLAKVADLKIISRTSVMQYKSGAPRNLREIAAQLGVANIVEGSVQRSGNKIRVTAQLIEARTDTHLWAEHFDRDLSDIFAIQSEIAQAIADQLRARLSPQEKAAINAAPTSDLAAYELYLRARVLYAESSVAFVHEKLPQAAHLLDSALERDPKFLLAWCLLARAHGDRYFGGDDHTPERLDAATAAVQAAVRLAPDAGETHLALADYYYHGFRDYARARSELDLARRTLPNNEEVYEYAAYIDRRQSRWDDALRNFGRALELDPRNFSTLQQMALLSQLLHRYDDVDRDYERALAIVPDDPGARIYRSYVPLDARADVTLFQKTRAALVAENPRVAPDVDDPHYALCERTPEAAARTLASYPKDGYANMGVNYPHAYWEGLVARWQGDAPRAEAAFTAARAEVEKTLAGKPDSAPALSVLAMIDAGLGRKEQAVAEGRHACEMLPVSKDALAGAAVAVNFAQTLAWVGEKAAAVDQIVAVEREPNLLSYGLLKLHPRWDDLRGDPRFDAAVEAVHSHCGY